MITSSMLLLSAAFAAEPADAAVARVSDAQEETPVTGSVQGRQLEPLQLEVERYPEDYSSWAALGARALELGAWEVAADAWKRAGELSQGNTESLVGRASALMGSGRWWQARLLLGRAVARSPDSASLRMLHASALAGGQQGSYYWGALLASHEVRRAAELSPHEDDLQCARGWSLLAIGDRMRAARAFAGGDPTDTCGVAGREASRSKALLTGSLYTIGTVYSGDDTYTGGISGLLAVGATLGGLFHFELAGRTARVFTNSSFREFDVQQHEVWGRVGAGHAGHGGDLLLGGSFVRGATVADNLTVAGRAWGTWFVRVGGEVAWTAYEDGNALQLGLGLWAPITPWLSLGAGVQGTGLAPSDGTAPAEGEGALSAWSGWVDASMVFGKWSVGAGGRFGREVRPVRVGEPTLWNFTDPLVGSGNARFGYQATPQWRVDLGYSLMRLSRDTSNPWIHVPTLGVTATLEAASR